MEKIKILILIFLGILLVLLAIKIVLTFNEYGLTIKGAENDVVIEAFLSVAAIYLFYTVFNLE